MDAVLNNVAWSCPLPRKGSEPRQATEVRGAMRNLPAGHRARAAAAARHAADRAGTAAAGEAIRGGVTPMVLKLQRRDDVEFQAYSVTSHDFPLGGIWHLDHSPVELWGWSIGTVYVFGDGHGPCQGGARSRNEAMEMFARRWRTWLALAGLREIDPASWEVDRAAPLSRSAAARTGRLKAIASRATAFPLASSGGPTASTPRDGTGC